LIRSKVKRGPKISKLGHVTQATPTYGSFYVPLRTQRGSNLHLCTKFEADSSIRSKVIKGSQNFEIGSRDLSYAPFEPETLNLCRNPSKHTYCHIL